MIFPLLTLLVAAPPPGLALIVTNNRSAATTRPDLRYADDDGAKYYQLFAEALGPENVVLLTEFDPESRLLYPELAAVAAPPTRENLVAAVASLRERINAAGEAATQYVVMAGHGDLDHGQGFIELAGSRFTARDLEELVIRALPTSRLHLILDSCNSYFMLNPRKPGGKRWSTRQDETESLLAKYPHVGAIISTSAEAVTYEWSDLQSGVFSYEVRSALRGAADVDGDGRVSYEELAAFVRTANAPVVNDLYRPKVFARAPNQDSAESFLTLSKTGSRLISVGADRARRLTFRDANGVRLLDVHKEAGTPLVLHLGLRAAMTIDEELDGGERPRVATAFVPATSTSALALEALSFGPPPVASRGDGPIFRRLFAEPFGRAALATAHDAPAGDDPRSFGVSTADAERLELFLGQSAAFEHDGRTRAAVIALASALALGSFAVVEGRRDDGRDHAFPIALGAAGGVTLGLLGAFAVALDSPSERLHRDYLAMDRSTEAGRAAAVLGTEAKLDEVVADYQLSRKLVGVTGLLAGGAALAMGGRVLSDRSSSDALGLPLLVLGTVSVGLGVHMFGGFRFPIERTWDLYQHDKDRDAEMTLAPFVGATSGGHGSTLLGLGLQGSL